MGNSCIRKTGNPKNNEAAIYEAQPKVHYEQLNTEADQKGETVVERIFRKSRTVLGQPASDLISPVDWSEYGLSFQEMIRPTPEEFPAFEKKDEGGGGHRPSVENVKTLSDGPSNKSKPESQATSKKPPKDIPETEKRQQQGEQQQSPGPKSKSTLAPDKSKSNDQSKDQSKDKSKDKSKDNSKDKDKPTNTAAAATSPDKKVNQKRVSHNVEMDHCSLEED